MSTKLSNCCGEKYVRRKSEISLQASKFTADIHAAIGKLAVFVFMTLKVADIESKWSEGKLI